MVFVEHKKYQPSRYLLNKSFNKDRKVRSKGFNPHRTKVLTTNKKGSLFTGGIRLIKIKRFVVRVLTLTELKFLLQTKIEQGTDLER